MRAVVVAVVQSIASIFRSRTALQIEVLALRHQLAVYQRAGRRPHLRPADRILWAWLSRAWSGWREALVIVQPRTVISWQRKRFLVSIDFFTVATVRFEILSVLIILAHDRRRVRHFCQAATPETSCISVLRFLSATCRRERE